MYCSKCGKEMPDTAKFCTACGAPAAKGPVKGSASDPAQETNRTKRILGISIASVLALAVVTAGGAAFHANRKAVRTEQESPVISETRPPESEDVPEPETVIYTGFVAQDDGLYYYDAGGVPAKGWFEENGSRYFASDDGRIYSSGAFDIDGMQYFFDEGGICIGDEKTFAEEDANLLQNLNADSRLTELMEVLVHGYIDDGLMMDGCTYSVLKTSEVQADINRLLNGEMTGIERLFEGEYSMAQRLSYTYENEPSNYLELYQQYAHECYLTREQIEYLVYSICGRQIDIDLSSDSGWHDPYLGFGGAAGDIAWNELRNFSVERVDADTWQMRADVYYGSEGWTAYIDEYLDLVGKICFTVIKNPDSYFDGYSIVNAEVELEEDIAWKLSYAIYIEDFERQINNWIDEYVSDYGLSPQAAADMSAGIRYDLIYIDDDDIPELYIEYPAEWIYQCYKEARIITYYDGRLIDTGDEYVWSFCEYIEGSGLCYAEFWGKWGYSELGVYKLENGRWKTIGFSSVDPINECYKWNGTEVSSYEEIERNINVLYDRAHSSAYGKSMSALEVIKLIYQDSEVLCCD